MIKINKIIYFILLILTNGCSINEKEQMIHYTNAVFYSCNDQFTIYTNMLTENNKIIALWNNGPPKYKAHKTVDLKQNYAYPGFIDAHSHFLGYAKELKLIDLREAKSFDHLIDILIQNTSEKENFILGSGWDHNNWPVKEFPNKRKLDSAFPDRPVYLERIDGHAVIVNDKLLETAGINIKSKIEGGVILKDEDGLTGVLIDKAISLVIKYIPVPDYSEIRRLLKQAEKNCFSKGLTMVCDAGLNLDDVKLLQNLSERGDLGLRIYIMLNPNMENLQAFKKPAINEKISIRSFKFYADGALGSRGALLLEPYNDDPENYGLHLINIDILNNICQYAIKHNFQVNTHCIGDSACRIILNKYGEYLSESNDRRWRIEHAQVISPDDLALFKKFRIIPSVQAKHAVSDMDWAENRLSDRIKYAYAYKSLLDQNGWIANSSDFPVEPTDPLLGFHAAVFRKDPKNQNLPPFQPENGLTRREALNSMTIWAARAAFEENSRGSLEAGKLADFVVINTDLINCIESELLNSRIISTYLDGKRVFNMTED